MGGGGGIWFHVSKIILVKQLVFFPFLSKIHFGSYCSWEERILEILN